MIEFGIALLVAALLAGLIIYWKKHKGCSSCCSSTKTPTAEAKAPESVKPQPETKPAAKAEPAPITPPPAVEKTKVAPAPASEPVKTEPTVKAQAETVKPQPVASSAAPKTGSDTAPEDSILRRHYLSNLASQAEAQQKPATSKKTAVAPAPAPQAAPTQSTVSVSIPEDSVLKRHYLGQVSAMIEALAGPRPTDSVLSRHYQATVAVELGRCLSDKTAMEKLVRNYANKK